MKFSKEEVLKILEYAKDDHGAVPFRIVKKAIEKLKVEPEWIPVSERLPEENMWTICQNNAGAMMIGKYDIEFGWMFPAYFDGIVAWMPLPPRYKGDKT